MVKSRDQIIKNSPFLLGAFLRYFAIKLRSGICTTVLPHTIKTGETPDLNTLITLVHSGEDRRRGPNRALPVPNRVLPVPNNHPNMNLIVSRILSPQYPPGYDSR